MNITIEIVGVTKEQALTKNNKAYTFLNVAYKNDGKIEGKKVLPFGNKEVFDTLSTAKAGELFSVVSEKNEGGFWEWVAITSGANAPVKSTEPTGTASSAVRSTPKSTYETPEERAARQILIVKQSSLSNAISLLKTDKKNPTVEEVIVVADQFTAWVLNTEPNSKVDTATEMQDDLPWKSE